MALPVIPAITNAAGGDANTNAAVRTFQQTQGTSDDTAQQAALIAGAGVTDIAARPAPAILTAAEGEAQIAAQIAGTGTSEVAAPITSAGVGATDDTARATNGIAQTAQDDGGASYGGGSQEEADAITKAQKTTTAAINTDGSNQKITPRPNILDRFSSYTYRASWYLMSPEQYKQLVLSHKKTVNGYQLLMQSGGAPVNSGGFKGAGPQGTNTGNLVPGANDADAGRNPAFPQDFYIDGITIENLFAGNGTRAPHAIKNIKFTVVEPNGITFLDRLYEAVQDYMPASGQKQGINYASVVYLMVIRFYGYDENGNLVTKIGAPDGTGKSDPNAVIEKFIPFKITKVDWSIESKLVTYSIEALAANQSIGAGTRRGTIPYDIQLTAKSIGELLGGDVQYSVAQPPAATPGAATTPATPNPLPEQLSGPDSGYTPPPPTAGAAPSPGSQLTQGLMGAMNDFQQNLVREGVYERADVYKIVFANPGPGGGGTAIEKALLIPPGKKTEKPLTATGAPPTTDPDAAAMDKTFADVKAKNYAITAGMQVVQAIELAIRNSTFITGQEVLFFDENDALQVKDGNTKDVVWFNITFQAVQLQYDNKRNDYAYEITFIINSYTPMNFSSNYFPINTFQGLHKQYNYWFTGKNSAVLEYKETMNNLYNLTISGAAGQESLGARQRRQLTSSMRDQPFYTFQSASTESRAGADGKQNEAASNLAENLYDPTGLANCKLKIVGDPAWMQQGSFAGGVNASEFDFNAFLPDGTINFDARQVMFEIAWQRPQDYDLNTGLADPYAASSKREPVQSRVYTARSCVSEFRQGSFTQTIDGLLYFFIKPNASNKASTAPPPDAALSGIELRDESGALSPLRKNPDTGELYTPVPGTRAQALVGTGLAPAGGAGTSSTINPSAITASAAADGARGQTSAVPVEPVNVGAGSGTPNVINAAPPGPNDTAAPANPPQPPTDGVGGATVAAAPLPVPAFASGVLGSLGGLVAGTNLQAQFNADLAKYAPGAASTRVTADGLQTEPTTPQNIAQDY
jgi:hypothetical protein